MDTSFLDISPGVLDSVKGGFIVILILGAVRYGRQLWSKWFELRQPAIKELRKKEIDGRFTPVYEGWRLFKLFKNPRSYNRTLSPAEQKEMEENPTFHFFSNDSTELDGFKGFLIPTLDAGHGRRRRPSGQRSRPNERRTRFGVDFNDKWKEYLEGLGRKFESTRGVAKRIVLFDRFILDLFIEETPDIVATAGLKTNGSLEFEDWAKVPEKRSTEFAQEICQAAFDTLRIHQISERYVRRTPGLPYQGIETRYIDKSQIQSNQYYDFGLYKMEGVPIVYNPIYRREVDRRIVAEKIYLGSFNDGVKQYEDDFDDLWKKEEFEKNYPAQRQAFKTHPGKKDAYWLSCDKYDAYIFEYFDRLYYRRLLRKWIDDLKWKESFK